MAKVIELSRSYDGPNGTKFNRVTMNEPTFRDYTDLGNPTMFVAVSGGGGFEQETPSVIRDWIERLYDGDSNFLYQLNLPDSLKLRDAVIDFFREARGLPVMETTSAPSDESSFSASVSTPQPSTI